MMGWPFFRNSNAETCKFEDTRGLVGMKDFSLHIMNGIKVNFNLLHFRHKLSVFDTRHVEQSLKIKKMFQWTLKSELPCWRLCCSCPCVCLRGRSQTWFRTGWSSWHTRCRGREQHKCCSPWFSPSSCLGWRSSQRGRHTCTKRLCYSCNSASQKFGSLLPMPKSLTKEKGSW